MSRGRSSFQAMEALVLAQIFACAFFAACLLQSGLDKVTDREGNLAWLVPHFENSPFRGKVPLMLTLLTLLELGSGLLSAVSVFILIFGGPGAIPTLAMALVCFTFVSLFAGQRIAKDYAGAASLAAYFAVALLGMSLMPGF